MTVNSGYAAHAARLAERIRALLSRGSGILEIVAEANRYYEEHGLGRLIIVGGYAAELYTGAAYRTGDVDLVVEGDPEVLRQALARIEEWRGRVWSTRGLRYAVDIVSRSYSGGKPPVRLRVDGAWVYVEAPEDAVLSSLRACVYWESHIDCERAAMILAAQWDRVDWDYLEAAAEKEGLSGMLRRIAQVAGEARESNVGSGGG